MARPLPIHSSSCMIRVVFLVSLPYLVQYALLLSDSYMPPWSLVSPIPCLGLFCLPICISGLFAYLISYIQLYTCLHDLLWLCMPSQSLKLCLRIVLYMSLWSPTPCPMQSVESFMCTLMFSYATQILTSKKHVVLYKQKIWLEIILPNQ